MRRLAVQTRNDGYSSKRDYQTITTKHSQSVTFLNNSLTFVANAQPTSHELLIYGIGGFIYPDIATNLKITVNFSERRIESRVFKLTNNWNRVGFCFDITNGSASHITITLEFDNATKASFWGLDFGDIIHPVKDFDSNIIGSLNQSHLCPEAYYFEHDTSINLDFAENSDFVHEITQGHEIELKKCSFCGRLLPLRSELLGALSFHKHNAKLSKHQNECRSCKKWRINDTFNPIRTTDQLHESSVITRERKLLLQEPIILKEIKKRTGEGLKSQIWEKFDRKCFFCKKLVKLEDFQLDHTRPLAYLWPIDEYATCLCSEHNNQKKDKFPIDFYSKNQLIELSKITGLPIEELSIKDVNEEQLNKILKDLEHYAKEWDARTFNAIARKVIEVRPQIDLFKRLHFINNKVYQELQQELQERPELY
ncbi:hypothetical protein [Pseudoalteromonas distincta]|uniref:hypothetical protein n=1 Tax=Pseudoalteromonas distincta TaxID=77608 RepID=UPI00186A3661|nr:hypothetical protein [Pseudoalteromonas distincta]MBE3672512.1 hypothetical protein [Pseudoalteromonas distincta KMM 3548]